MSEEARKSSIHRQMSVDNAQGLLKIGALLGSCGLLFMAGFYLLVYHNVVMLYPRGLTEDKLTGFASKAEYALRYQTLLMFWLIFNVISTMYGRAATRAVNPLVERTECRVQMFKNILTNSFEQIFISVISQLTFVSFAENTVVFKYIPLVNVLQFIGRITFFAGYPDKRSFGFVCTMIPNVIMLSYNLYKFGSFVGFY